MAARFGKYLLWTTLVMGCRTPPVSLAQATDGLGGLHGSLLQSRSFGSRFLLCCVRRCQPGEEASPVSLQGITPQTKPNDRSDSDTHDRRNPNNHHAP